MAKNILVIDQGGQSTRAIVFTATGHPIAYSSEQVDDALVSTCENHNQSNNDRHVEYAIEPIIQSTRFMLDRLVPQLTAKQFKQITSVAIIAQRSSLVACNRKGKAITEMLSWQDTRNSLWLDQLGINHKDYQHLTGLRCNPHMGSSKMRWLLDHDSKVKSQAKHNDLVFMPWGAYFLHQLKRDKVTNDSPLITDPVLAARTGLVEYGELEWSTYLLNLFGIPLDFLPHIVASTYHYGALKIEDRSIPITLLGGDQNFISCAYGFKKLNKSLFANIGTGAFMQGKTASKTQSSLLLTHAAVESSLDFLLPKDTKNKAVEKINIIEGTINAAATLIEWWLAKHKDPYSHAELDQIIETVTKPPVFIHSLTGTGSPFWLTAKQSQFIGNKPTYNLEEKTLAIIESILFSCKTNTDIIFKENKKLNKIIISGGLSKSNAICQLFSDLTQKKIIRYEDNEASARGVVFYVHKKKNYKPEREPTIFTPNKEKGTKTSPLALRFEEYHQTMQQLCIKKS